MEKYLRLYKSMRDLVNGGDKSLTSAIVEVRRLTLAKLKFRGGREAPENILDLSEADAVKYLIDKCAMMALPNTYFNMGSPFYGEKISIEFSTDEHHRSLMSCVTKEYPNCCGSLTLSSFSEYSAETAEYFPRFMEVVCNIARIARYSNISFILSEKENRYQFQAIKDLIKDGFIVNSFINERTNTNCSFLTKNL